VYNYGVRIKISYMLDPSVVLSSSGAQKMTAVRSAPTVSVTPAIAIEQAATLSVEALLRPMERLELIAELLSGLALRCERD
jgi:hypothetical protein